MFSEIRDYFIFKSIPPINIIPILLLLNIIFSLLDKEIFRKIGYFCILSYIPAIIFLLFISKKTAFFALYLYIILIPIVLLIITIETVINSKQKNKELINIIYLSILLIMVIGSIIYGRILRATSYQNTSKYGKLGDGTLLDVKEGEIKDGIHYGYFSNGQLGIKATFNNDILDGEYVTYYRNPKGVTGTPQIYTKGNFKNGKKHGIWKKYETLNNEGLFTEELYDLNIKKSEKRYIDNKLAVELIYKFKWKAVVKKYCDDCYIQEINDPYSYSSFINITAYNSKAKLYPMYYHDGTKQLVFYNENEELTKVMNFTNPIYYSLDNKIPGFYTD